MNPKIGQNTTRIQYRSTKSIQIHELAFSNRNIYTTLNAIPHVSTTIKQQNAQLY
ncbi:hypothetical protein HMPREF3204_00529 [Gardnerella pickettii]|nr:hypothetical protein HMPREF3204_00529 [Gardnerella pickettii]